MRILPAFRDRLLPFLAIKENGRTGEGDDASLKTTFAGI